MKVFLTLAAVLQVSLAGHVSVSLPYQNPAGVTYLNGQYQNYEFPSPYSASLSSSSSSSPSTYSASSQSFQYNQGFQYQQPLQYHQAYAAAPAYPAKIESHHVGYAAAQVPAVAAVPYVKHVPTVSHIPVTRYEAQPAVIEKQLDVAKPAVSTRKFEVRRPAIQKQFYDIEERVIVRPAGSAVVELDEPTSKRQRGPAVVQSIEGGAYLAAGPFSHKFIGQSFPSTPSSIIDESSASQQSQSQVSDEEVVVDNPEFRSSSNSYGQNSAEKSQDNQQQEQQQPQEANSRQVSPAQTPNVEARSNGIAIDVPSPKFRAHDSNPSSAQVIPSPRNSPEENQSNQQKLIDLLTARGAVAEVGYGRDGEASTSVSEGGHVRARVISATPAPEYAEAAGERVSTRRVVVSRPIETLQEVDVVEPATKLERVSVHQPTYIKTARLDHVQVHGSIPVVGKAYTPAIAHAAVPVYQKTISPAYSY